MVTKTEVVHKVDSSAALLSILSEQADSRRAFLNAAAYSLSLLV